MNHRFHDLHIIVIHPQSESNKVLLRKENLYHRHAVLICNRIAGRKGEVMDSDGTTE